MTVGVGMLNACEDTADKASSRVGRIEVEESMTMVDNVRQYRRGPRIMQSVTILRYRTQVDMTGR